MGADEKLTAFRRRKAAMSSMRAARLHEVLKRLTAAIRDVESELAAMKAEQDR